MEKRMKRIVFIGFAFCFCSVYADIYEDNQKKINEIDEKISRKSLDLGIDTLGVFGAVMSPDIISKFVSSYRISSDVYDMVKLLKERYKVTKDENERKSIAELIEKSEKSPMAQYREAHENEQHSSEPDCVGGLRE